MIHDVDTGRGVPDVKYAPTLDLPELKTTPLTSAIDTYVKLKEEEQKTVKGNLAGITQAYDEITKVRYDNGPQKAQIDAAKERAGVGEDMFRLSAEQLKNPYILGPLSKATVAFTNDPAIRDVIREQTIFDAGFKDFSTNPPANPVLRNMFLKDVEAYRDGKISGLTLNPKQYADLDIGADLAKRIKEIPMMTSSELVDDEFVTYEKKIQKRSHDVITAVVGERLNDPLFKNNMIARGFMTPDGQYTTAGSDYIEKLKQAYAEEISEITGIRNKPSSLFKNYGSNTNPAQTSGLAGIDGQLYNGYYQVASSYGVPLDDPNNVNLNMHVLAEIGNSKKDTSNRSTEQARMDVTRVIRKEALRSGDGLKAMFDHAVDAGFAGSAEDFVGALSTNDWTSLKAQATAYPAIMQAITDLVGPNNEEQTWNKLRQQLLNPNELAGSTVPGQPGVGPTAPSASSAPFSLSELFIDSPRSGGSGGGGAADDDFIDLVFASESGNDPTARSSTSSAAGLGGFTKKTWLATVNDFPEMRGKSEAERLAILTSPKDEHKKIVRRAAQQLTAKNAKSLEESGLTTDNLNLYLAHHFGAYGAKRILAAPVGDPISKHVSEEAYAANDYLHGKTVGQVIDINANKMNFYTPRTFKGSKHYKTWKDIGGGKGDRIDKRVIALMDSASDYVGKKVVISSGFRDKHHNEKAGGASKSQHMEGHGVDIITTGLSNTQKKNLLQHLLSQGAKGIGFYDDGHLHFDLRKGNLITWGTTPSWAKGLV